MARTLKPETLAQIAVFDWIRLHKEISPYAFHIPNEGKRSYFMGAILKRMGMRSGVSDIFIAIPNKTYHGAFIELKEGKNKPTNSQLQFLQDMSDKGYFTKVCFGSDETIECIKQYMSLK
jgi:hypothetical protein